MLNSLLFVTKQRPYVLLLVFTTIVWLGSIHANTIGIDTYWLVESNRILQHVSIENLEKILFDFSLGTRLTLGSEYLPMRDLSVMLDFFLFGENWLFHRLHSILLYLISGFFLLKIAFSILGKNTLTWLGVFCYMVHPTHVESVVWLASRKDVLSLLLGLIGFWSYVKNRKMVLPTLLFLLAYWAKNTAIVFPPLLVFYSLLIEKASPLKLSWWRKWPVMVLTSLFALSITMKTGNIVRIFAERRGDNLFEGASISAQSWWSYGEMMLFPTNLSLLYSEPSAEFNSAAILGLILVLVLFGSIILGLWKKWYPFVFFLLWIVFSFLPVSQIIPIQNLIADRYVLLPSVGFCLLFALPWKSSLQQNFLLIWAVFLSFLTIERCALFQSSLALWTDITQKQPHDVRGWTVTIAMLEEEGQMKQAQQTLGTAFQYVPNHPALLQSQGNLALAKNDLLFAEESFLEAWKRDDNLRKSANNLIVIYQRQGDFEKAKQIAKELTTTHPLYANGWNTLGAAGLGSRDLELASTALNRAYELDPYSPSILSNLGDLYYLQQDFSKAEYFWIQTLQYDPDHEHAKQGLGAIQGK